MSLLVNNFNPAAIPGLMCRDTVSVGWNGVLYDCDFNQQLAIPLGEDLIPLNADSSREATTRKKQQQRTVFEINSLDELLDEGIAVDLHCFGCTAGSGSSCQGATVVP